ncbi:acyltransferase family protein [Roseovarius amoyensis]|uniref:acyltransferase family protein n=1 Tax=Roseovarius amoyensis TaxID=2211448 RepID=UPI0013A6B523|nr:acyltransferase family protein [Roseovarius amoyensis]
MNYSKEIDGLRAISVILVIVFHVQNDWLPGGFIGVDVFFVISGFLITSLIYRELLESGRFSFAKFYRRRFARLLPALFITLLVTYILAFLFYGPQEFDSLGKDIFFSAFGIKNLHDAGGANYFVQDETYKPLLHMWSLGVEEQFYVVWPFILLLVYTVFKRNLMPSLLTLLSVSIIISEYGASSRDVASYFMPQFRAFELLSGAVVAVYLINRKSVPLIKPQFRSVITFLSLATILVLSVLLSEKVKFPGINALLVVVPALVLIVYSGETSVGRLLSQRALVTIGLVSYPLYLFHQPIISFMTLWNPSIDPLTMLLIVMALGFCLSYLTYLFIETPIRRMAKTRRGGDAIISLVSIILSMGALGLWTAKSQGLPQRLSILNPYAYSISESLSSSFHNNFNRGIYKGASSEGKILFFGDSLLQQYVLPLSQYWGYDADQIDVISRGGCVLLKSAEYEDSFSDISCDELRTQLFELTGPYERIVFSQAWDSYGGDIINLPGKNNSAYSPEEWRVLVEKTVSHFSKQSGQIFIIGSHPRVESKCGNFINTFTSPATIADCLKETKIEYEAVQHKDKAFADAMADMGAYIIQLGQLWCDDSEETCRVSNTDGRPFFRDSHHFGSSADAYLTGKLQASGL